MEIESFQDFVHKRNQRINKFYLESSVAHQMYKETALMIRKSDLHNETENEFTVTYADLK